MTLELVPLTITEGKAFVTRVHRHHPAPAGAMFAIGAAQNGEVVGVVMVGRPVSRVLAVDDYTAEVTRLASTGERNVCSLLYAAAWRACRAMGYRRLITYTLATEPGTSLRAVGFREVGRVPGRSWDTPSRPRVDRHPTVDKLRWEMTA
jgi:L-amino acid N-acyltransferase YncA